MLIKIEKLRVISGFNRQEILHVLKGWEPSTLFGGRDRFDEYHV